MNDNVRLTGSVSGGPAPIPAIAELELSEERAKCEVPELHQRTKTEEDEFAEAGGTGGRDSQDARNGHNVPTVLVYCSAACVTSLFQYEERPQAFRFS